VPARRSVHPAASAGPELGRERDSEACSSRAGARGDARGAGGLVGGVVNETARASLRALGTTATICTTPPSALAEARSIVERELREVDSSCSRFRPDSELATLNRRGGTRSVGERLYEAIVVALRGAAATDGLVDPTIGRSLRLAGYDRDFELLSGRSTPIVRFVPAARWERVELHEVRRTVTLPR